MAKIVLHYYVSLWKNNQRQRLLFDIFSPITVRPEEFYFSYITAYRYYLLLIHKFHSFIVNTMLWNFSYIINTY